MSEKPTTEQTLKARAELQRRIELYEKFLTGIPTAQLERATAEGVGLAELVEVSSWLVDALRYHTGKHSEDDILDALADRYGGQFADKVQQCGVALAPFTGDDNA